MVPAPGSRFPVPGSSFPASGRPFSEAELSRLWAGQRFPASALVTRQGVPVRVLHPGRAGRGAGPDFRDALIAPPSGRPLRGDVELHVRASDFRAHGHHRDPAYDGVALHLVFEDDGRGDTRLACGRRAPVVALAPWLRRRTDELATWLSGPRLWREPCQGAMVRLGEETVRRTLEELGGRRFRAREGELAESVRERGAGGALYLALLEGLAYGGERDTMTGVAAAVPWSDLASRLAEAGEGRRAALAEALLLGAAGLLPQEREGAADESEAEMVALWGASGLAGRRAPEPAARVAVRPANHPARRLAGLARLIDRHGALLAGRGEAGIALGAPASEMIAGWTVPAEGYWRRNVAPGLPARRPPGALIGRSRAIELLVNAVLPWAAAWAGLRGDGEAADRAREAFAKLPRPGRYGALGFLERNLSLGRGGPRLDARRQQGLLALYKLECTQGGCGRCPLS